MKTFSRRLQDVFVCRRRLQDVLIKTNIFVLVICLEDVFKTSSRRLARTSSWRHPQDVLGRYLQDVFKTYDHISIQHVFEMYCKDDYLQKDLPGSYFWGIYSQGTKFSRMNSLDIWKLLKQFFKTLYKVARYYC